MDNARIKKHLTEPMTVTLDRYQECVKASTDTKNVLRLLLEDGKICTRDVICGFSRCWLAGNSDDQVIAADDPRSVKVSVLYHHLHLMPAGKHVAFSVCNHASGKHTSHTLRVHG